MNAFEQLLPRCRHGRPTRESCPQCVAERGKERARTESLVDRMARHDLTRAVEPLNLPPLGPHVASVCHVKGRFVVTCGCKAGFRVKGDRYQVEAAWGVHRGVTL